MHCTRNGCCVRLFAPDHPSRVIRVHVWRAMWNFSLWLEVRGKVFAGDSLWAYSVERSEMDSIYADVASASETGKGRVSRLMRQFTFFALQTFHPHTKHISEHENLLARASNDLKYMGISRSLRRLHSRNSEKDLWHNTNLYSVSV